MRGNTQAHLIEADDGLCYVVKFKNNPQHRRILINEFLGSAILRRLNISTPTSVVINVSTHFLAENADVYIECDSQRFPVEVGWHFGSLYPGHPLVTSVYDFIPASLFGRVTNGHDFAGAFVFDRWTANSDRRQSVYTRTRWDTSVAHPHSLAQYLALMIDNGSIFNGRHWNFPDPPIQHLYDRPKSHITPLLVDIEFWMQSVRSFPECVIQQAVQDIPSDWMLDQERALAQLISELLDRRRRIEEFIYPDRSFRS